MLALRQPMAGDLRRVVAALKITGDLERIGDYAAVFASRNLMPQFPVPDGETEDSFLRAQAEGVDLTTLLEKP